MYDNEKLLLNHFAKYVKEIFEGSYNAFDVFDDAISFAYGWLMLAFSLDNKILILKLENIDNTKNSIDCSFIKYPITQIIKILAIDFEIITYFKIKILDERRDSLLKILTNKFNQFLIEFYNQRQKFENIDINHRKKIIEDLIIKVVE